MVKWYVRRIDLAGRKFGKLTVLPKWESSKYGPNWLCLCDCGKLIPVLAGNLRNGNTRSCGCLRWDGKHLQARDTGRTPAYNSYIKAKHRCICPNFKQWKDYGGRGIEFRFQSFEEFFMELGPRPEHKTLDRIDVNGHYEKGNVRWATRLEQQRNRRR
jgi:hypothetical protein